MGIVRHHCGPREVEAKTHELVKAPETRSTRLIGLIRLEGQLDLLAVIHAISKIDATTEPAMGHAAHLASRRASFGHSDMSPSTAMVTSVMQQL